MDYIMEYRLADVSSWFDICKYIEPQGTSLVRQFFWIYYSTTFRTYYKLYIVTPVSMYVMPLYVFWKHILILTFDTLTLIIILLLKPWHQLKTMTPPLAGHRREWSYRNSPLQTPTPTQNDDTTTSRTSTRVIVNLLFKPDVLKLYLVLIEPRNQHIT